jgi:hypothetical protein
VVGEVVEKVVQTVVYYVFSYVGFSRMRLILIGIGAILEKPVILQRTIRG